MIELAPLDTARFAVCCGKLLDVTALPDEVEAEARRLGVKLLTARFDVAELPRVHAFERVGYQLMDTLVHYRRSTLDLPPLAPPVSPRIRPADPSDAPATAEVARKAFRGYIGHYHADPKIDHLAADAAYVEWAEKSTIGVTQDRPVLVAEVGGRIAGFLTMRRNSLYEMEVVLNAVDPDQQGQGLYTALLLKSLSLSAQAGASQIVTSTQVNNYAVQRVWCRHGFTPYKAVYTFHKWFEFR